VNLRQTFSIVLAAVSLAACSSKTEELGDDAEQGKKDSGNQQQAEAGTPENPLPDLTILPTSASPP
jgi:hypothetical protein